MAPLREPLTVTITTISWSLHTNRAIVRDNECARGMVADVMRVTVSKTRRPYVLPATLHKVKGPTSRWSQPVPARLKDTHR